MHYANIRPGGQQPSITHQPLTSVPTTSASTIQKATLFDKAPLVLTDGVGLSLVEVAYETYGELNAEKSNVILICHALTGDSHAAPHFPGDRPGWWEGLVGPGRLFDTEKYFLLCSNLLGSCYGTTGPNSINPATGEKWGEWFPYPSMRDVVEVQRELLDYLGIEKVALVVGGSLGGQQVLQWTVQYPGRLGAAIPIACNARATDWIIALQDVGRQAILHALKYPDLPELLDQALATARMLAMISYRSPKEFDSRFRRTEVDQGRRDGQNLRYEVESYLRYQGHKLVERFEAHSYLRLTRILDSFDLSAGYASEDEALQRIQCPICLVGIDTDVLFHSDGPRRLAGRLRNLGKQAEFKLLSSIQGHDAFLVEFEQLSRILEPFFEKVVAGP